MDTQPDTILDLFAGPGGWSEGIRAHLGLRDIGIEYDTAACKTRAAAGHSTVQADVAVVPVAPMVGKVRGLIASPPCQAWSRAGKRLGLTDQPVVHQAVHDLALGRDTRAELLAMCKDPRSLLAAEPMRYLHAIRPEWTVMEEVPDVLPLWRHYAEILRGWGYSVWVGELNAADYGVPQTRRRAILIASRVRQVTAPEPTHAKHAEDEGLFGPSREQWVSMAEALGWGVTDRVAPTVTAGGGKTGGAEPFPSQARASLIEAQERGAWILHTNRNQQPDGSRQTADPAAGPAPTLMAKSGGQWVLKSRRDSDAWVAAHGERPNRGIHEPAPVFTGEAHRWSWERPATTVCATDRVAPPGHRDRSTNGESQFASPDTVRISVAEAAVLQSFPADYPWQGTKTKQFEQVGNAVPPLLAAHVVSAASGVPFVTPSAAAAA